MVIGKNNFERTKSTVLKLQYGPRDNPLDPTKSPCGDIANRGHYEGPGDTNPKSEFTCEGKH